MSPNQNDLWGIVIALLGGAAVGVERQWSGHALHHFAGVRTFTLLGTLAGLAGWLWSQNMQAIALILAIGAAVLIVVAYWAASKHDIDGTTEMAALVVLAAGILAGSGSWRLASAITAGTALLLAEKSRLHALIGRLSGTGLQAGLRFAVMALIVLPLLPEGPFGPLDGVRPRELWILVLFFTGLSFAGYVARTFAGPGRGYVLAGLLGGIISSTNVTLTFARTSKAEVSSSASLGLGVIAACSVLYARVAIASFVLNPAFAAELVKYLAAPALAGLMVSIWGWRRRRGSGAESPPERNPLQLVAALQMAALFQIVLFAVTLARQYWGQAGLLTSGAILGLTDVDALTISMSKVAGQSDQLPIAAAATAVGILVNTLLKLALAISLGSPEFRRLAAVGLMPLAAGSAISLFVLLR